MYRRCLIGRIGVVHHVEVAVFSASLPVAPDVKAGANIVDIGDRDRHRLGDVMAVAVIGMDVMS